MSENWLLLVISFELTVNENDTKMSKYLKISKIKKKVIVVKILIKFICKKNIWTKIFSSTFYRIFQNH